MLFAFLLLLLSSLAPALAVPPCPPVRCGGEDVAGCVLSNAHGAWSSNRANCPMSAVEYPASEREVVAVVVRASAGGTRVKVVSGSAHNIPKLACPGGGRNDTLLISTARLAGMEVDAAARMVTADASAPLRDVVDAVEARGLPRATSAGAPASLGHLLLVPAAAQAVPRRYGLAQAPLDASLACAPCPCRSRTSLVGEHCPRRP